MSAIAALAVLFTGCRDEMLAPSGSVTLETDAIAYVAVRDANAEDAAQFTMEMLVAVSNDTERPVTLQGCAIGAAESPRFAVSMAATLNDWSAAYENYYGCSTPIYMTLAVGESRVDRIELVGPRLYDATNGAPIGTLEGRMRLVYYVNGLTVGSNAFEVRLDTLPR